MAEAALEEEDDSGPVSNSLKLLSFFNYSEANKLECLSVSSLYSLA